MTNTKRVLIILSVVVGTPLLGLAFGSWGASRHNDPSGLTTMAGFGLGIFAMVISLIDGVIVSYFMRNSKRQSLSLLGYVIPAALVLFYIFLINLF